MPVSLFVGRRLELQFLDEQFRLGCTQGARLVLLSAPAGTGKTSLVKHFLDTLAGQCLSGMGRGWDNLAAVPYHPLREALAQLPQPSRQANPYLRTFFNDFTSKKLKALPPEGFFPASVTFLRAQTQSKPLCLFLDDLQWADEATFAWLDFAFTQLTAVPVLLIGAYRSEEAQSLTSLLSRRSQWYQTGRFGEYALGNLSRIEVDELIRQTVPAEKWAPGLSAKVWERSEGVALLAVEEVRAWTEGRKDTPHGQALIASRLAQLSPADREVLCLAAVIGERFGLELLAGTLGCEALELARRLEKLRCEHGVLEDDGAGYRFAHNRYREALLAGMSLALQQRYHARLSQQSGHLSPSDHTYHLAQSGDIEKGVAALLAEGSRILGLMNWRDAWRYYAEALALAQKAEIQEAGVYLDIYQRMGDLQLLVARKHPIARTYYEAARSWARTPRQQVLLLCRLAETCRMTSPQRREYLAEAARYLSEAPDPALQDWLRFWQAFSSPFQDREYWPRIYQLSARVKPVPDIPPEIQIYASENLLHAAAVLGNTEEIDQQLERLEDLPPDTWETARLHAALASAFSVLGDWPRVIEHQREARRIFTVLDRPIEVVHCHELGTLVATGQYQEVRAIAREFKPGSILEFLYQSVCDTWIHDRPPEGLEWAARYLRGVETFFLEYPTDGGHLRVLLSSLGRAERIFRELGPHEEFRRRLVALRETLRKAGYQTDAVWFLGEAVELPELPPVDSTAVWTCISEDHLDRVCQDQEGLVFRVQAKNAGDLLNLPRMGQRNEGDFALQCTLHPGAEVLEGMLQCRQTAPTGCIPRGGGGLYALRDQAHWLRLSAHVGAPSEVLFEMQQEGNWRVLGRGLLEDGPLSLRLERRGAKIAAYAGNQGGSWYCCGEIDLPAWGQLEIGLYGDYQGQLFPGLIGTTETRIRDLRLEATVAPPVEEHHGDCPYLLPSSASAPGLPEMVTANQEMLRLLKQVQETANAKLPVLIEGETGTGKELVVRALHKLGNRARGPFVPLNCATIPVDLLDRELFGHVRGAYSGAYENRGGLFEAADRGILFLDEIDSASPAFQARLLRVLEEQAVRRVGDQRLRQIDVRIVSATNRDLAQDVVEERFRKDLYYRLKGVEFHLLPLRERREDIPHLVSHLLHRWAQREGRPLPGITQWAMAMLMDYDWPGNVRELFHTLERAAESAQGALIEPELLGIRSPLPLGSTADERQQLSKALSTAGGNVSAAARMLGISRNTI